MIEETLYQEKYRPQFHFTAKKNWLNDPNGLIYYDGEYHLFFQHNPSGINWGNMTWGHAVSTDVVHWEQFSHAIEPDELGTIFSGSGVVDWNNTTGFQTGQESVLVAIYTSAGEFAPKETPYTQSIAYSVDRGRTWTKYEGNSVLSNLAKGNRDPKVFWHKPTKKWVMALYLENNDFALFGSPDLKSWTKLSDVHLPDASECPDLFELPVDADQNRTKWVFWGANGRHFIGTFDGEHFDAESDVLQTEHGANCYAAQTWSDIPSSDNRRLQIAWMSGGKYPDMPFNQQMAFPCELTLRTTADGIRLFRKPVKEIETIHKRRHTWNDEKLTPAANLLDGIEGELLDIRAEIELGDAKAVGFGVRGENIHFDIDSQRLACLEKSASLQPINERISLQILVDRTSIEVFGNDGRVSMCSCFLPDMADRSLKIFASGGTACIVSLDVYELHSAWSP
ncbi:MAG: glycoside hydrolase family 32 protein [Candidatus Poribacteria bacterium]|nr:glycoside hydrolase family 32 protein [Candidatus Poribacteria bacterium]MDE0505051.1 glycoside hydrolase family 32 protein [Candidatus Poribacteria bacterium]